MNEIMYPDDHWEDSNYIEPGWEDKVSSLLSEARSQGRQFLSLLEIMSKDWSSIDEWLKVPFENEDEDEAVFGEHSEQTDKESLPMQHVEDSDSDVPYQKVCSRDARNRPHKYFAGYIVRPERLILISKSDTCDFGNVLAVTIASCFDGTLRLDSVCCLRRIAHTPLILRHGQSGSVVVFERQPSGGIQAIELDDFWDAYWLESDD